MRTVGVFEAKNRLTALLDEVERGGEILITRRGKPIARVVSATPGFDRDKARRAAAGLRALSKGRTLAASPSRTWSAKGGGELRSRHPVTLALCFEDEQTECSTLVA